MIHVDETTPLCDFVGDKQGNLSSAKNSDKQRKCRQDTQRNFLNNAERVPHTSNLHDLEPGFLAQTEALRKR